MACRDSLMAGLDAVESAFVLLGVTVYRIVLFMIFLSASIAPSVMFRKVYDNVTGLDPLPEVVESMICMMLIRCWAEFSVGVEPQVCGNTLDSYKFKYPNTMTFGRFTVNFVLYMAAFCQLYIQFEESHTYVDPKLHQEEEIERNNQVATATDNLGARNHGWHTALFLLSLSYLVFTTSKVFHKNVIRVIRDLPATYSILSNCMIRVGFAVIHMIVNVLYFLPCLAIVYTAKSYKTTGHALFFQLCCTAALSGMIAALFEMNKPWPRERGQMPFLHFENNVITKDKLTLTLVGIIIVFYYRPFDDGKIQQSEFDSTNCHVINFCMSVAFTVLHVVKFGVHAILTLAHDYDLAREEQGILPIPQLPPTPGRSASGLASQEILADQMCQRCTDNLLNNNAVHEVSHVPPSRDNNNEELPRPEKEKEKTEIISPVRNTEGDIIAKDANQEKINEQVERHLVVEVTTVKPEVDLKPSQSYIV